MRILTENLAAFKGAFTYKFQDQDGNVDEYICIPIEKNNLFKGKNDAVYANLIEQQSTKPRYGEDVVITAIKADPHEKTIYIGTGKTLKNKKG